VITPEDDDFTELHDAVVPRVDLVGKGANGMPFLIAKSAAPADAGIFTTDYVRHLIDTQETPVTAPVAKADTAAADLLRGDDEPLPDGEEVNAGATADADGTAAPTPAPGDPDDPKAAAWEAVDAARAREALQLTVALKRLVTTAQEREEQESAVSGEESDFENGWTMANVLMCLDEVLGLLAPFAITEQAEADQMTAEVAKSGRTLSSANEQKIRGATEALQSVLATLPAATTDDASVFKETPVDDETTAKTEDETPAEESVEKAKGDPMQIVYDENGKVVGMIDPTALVEVAAPGGEEPAEEPDATDPAAAAADVATVPGTATVQAPVQKEEDTEVAKAVADSVNQALAEVLSPLVKQLEEHSGLADVVKGLQESVERMSREPNDRKSPLVSGGNGTPGMAQRDGSTIDPFADLRKAASDATGSAKDKADMALALAVIKGHPSVTGGAASPWQANAADVTTRFS
jgi:hypothetical protein